MQSGLSQCFQRGEVIVPKDVVGGKVQLWPSHDHAWGRSCCRLFSNVGKVLKASFGWGWISRRFRTSQRPCERSKFESDHFVWHVCHCSISRDTCLSRRNLRGRQAATGWPNIQLATCNQQGGFASHKVECGNIQLLPTNPSTYRRSKSSYKLFPTHLKYNCFLLCDFPSCNEAPKITPYLLSIAFNLSSHRWLYSR